MTTIFADAPDGQNAIVTSQVLLATLSGGTRTATVTPPVNTETLIVLASNASTSSPLEVLGNTSAVQYPGVLVPSRLGLSQIQVYYFEICPAIDASYVVAWTTAPSSSWSIISDAGIRAPVDPSLALAISQQGKGVNEYGFPVFGSDNGTATPIEVDANGRLIPLVPTSSSGLVVATTAGVTLEAAPGTGHNYLFGVDVEGLTAVDVLTLSTVATGTFAILTAPLNATATLDLEGFATAQLVTATTSIDTANVVLRFAPGP